MSLEARVAVLEQQFKALDFAVRENYKIQEATHGVVSLILKEQREKFRSLEQAHNKRFNKIEDRFNKIEEILIQIVNNLASR